MSLSMPYVIKIKMSKLIVRISASSVYLISLLQSGLTMKRNTSMPAYHSTDTITNNGFQIGEKQEH